MIRSTAEEFCHCIYKSVQNTENVLDFLAISHTIRVKGQRLTRNGCQRQSRNGCGLSQTKSGAANLRTITMEINCTCLTAPCLPRLLQLGGRGDQGHRSCLFSKSTETRKATQWVIGKPELQSKIISIYTHICVELAYFVSYFVGQIWVHFHSLQISYGWANREPKTH